MSTAAVQTCAGSQQEKQHNDWGLFDSRVCAGLHFTQRKECLFKFLREKQLFVVLLQSVSWS